MNSRLIQCKSLLDDITRATSEAVRKAEESVSQAQAKLKATPDAQLKSAEQLLDEELCLPTQELDNAVARLEEVSRMPLLKRLFASGKAEVAVDHARGRLRQARRLALLDEATLRRSGEVDHRVAQNAAHHACKDAVRQVKATLAKYHKAQDHLAQRIVTIDDALNRRAWFAADAEARITTAAALAQKGFLISAAQALEMLQYQRLPSEETLRDWVMQCVDVVSRIQGERSGFSAIAAFPGIVNPSLAQAKCRCHVGAWVKLVSKYEDVPDRWHALLECMLTPRALLEPIQWIMYWAFLIESQRFAVSLGRKTVHEDVLTGMLCHALSGQLEGSAKDRLQKLGYPSAKANLSFLQLAGLKGEYLTGADIGFIVQIDVGDLRVHKVALLQAKVSVDGRANIGSDPSGATRMTQLQKLRDTERDFFLFFNSTKGASPALLPTVTSVKHFVDTHSLDEAALKRPSISVQSRTHGWDLPSFVAFGLCTPGNSMGKDVPAGGDPLEVLLAGGRSSLPAYMIVVSLGDDEVGFHRTMAPLKTSGYRSAPRSVDHLDRTSPSEQDDHTPGMG